MQYFQKRYVVLFSILVVLIAVYGVYHYSHPSSIKNQVSFNASPTSQKTVSQSIQQNAISTSTPTSSPTSTPSTSTQSTTSTIMVDIKGAVKSPGVYKFNVGERVVDAIKKSGGFLPEADQKQINLAQKLQDEMVIYVLKKGEKQENSISSVQNSPSVQIITGQSNGNSTNSVIHLNTATSEELQTLTGIGPVKAQAILDYRKQNGPFKSIDDLLNVTGIGEKSLEKIKGDIVLN